MIYYNKNMAENVALHNYINTHLSTDAIVKNGFVYSDAIDLDTDDAFSYIEDYEDYLIYLINGLVNISLSTRISLSTFEINNELDLSKLGNFSFIEEGFFPSGNCVCLYFSTKLISNPLDVIYSINNFLDLSLDLSLEYFDVVMDYMIFEDKIVYYIMFRYSLLLENNLDEIIRIKELLSNSFVIAKCSDKHNTFPGLQVRFEEKYLTQFPILTDEDKLLFEGLSKHSPMFRGID